jgi:hypothetical protein
MTQLTGSGHLTAPVNQGPLNSRGALTVTVYEPPPPRRTYTVPASNRTVTV